MLVNEKTNLEFLILQLLLYTTNPLFKIGIEKYWIKFFFVYTDDNVGIYSTWGVLRKGDETAIRGVAKLNNAAKCSYDCTSICHFMFQFQIIIDVTNSYSVTIANGPQLPIILELFWKHF